MALGDPAMPEAIQEHASGRRYPDLGESMGLNKRRWGNGERDARPSPRRPVPEEARQEGGDGEGRQYPAIPGQADLFPAPAGSAKDQRLLF